MKNKMLSIVTDPIREDELKRIFAGFPFASMSGEYHRATGFDGITLNDGSICVRADMAPELTLMVYLHEVAHASLLRAGHPRWNHHNEDFVKLCRGMQMRFGVAGQSWHAYDQQDAVIKTTADQAHVVAYAAAQAIQFDPTQRAVYAAIDAVSADRRHSWRYVLIVGGLALLSMVVITQPIGAWWNVMLSALDGDAAKLAGGLALVGWLWLNLRGGAR